MFREDKVKASHPHSHSVQHSLHPFFPYSVLCPTVHFIVCAFIFCNFYFSLHILYSLYAYVLINNNIKFCCKFATTNVKNTKFYSVVKTRLKTRRDAKAELMWVSVALYRETGRSECPGGNQCKVTATLSPMINVSPSVTFVGGPGLRGSARTRTTTSTDTRLTPKTSY